MSTAAFDTLSAAQDLEAAGIERKHAEAIAKVVHHGDERAATKADLAAAIAGLEARMYRALWIQAVAIIGTQLAIAGFVVHLLSQP